MSAVPQGPSAPDARGRAAWRAARGWDELVAAGAAFLAGHADHFPGWGAATTDAETDAILAELLALQALGFLSTASQPAFDGLRGARRVQQRAFVAGFAPRALAERLCRPSALDVRAWHADGSTSGGAGRAPAAVTREDGQARVVVGADARAEELALFADDLGADALEALGAASYVVALEPERADPGRFWPELLRLGRA
jgi:hypothetical protein